MTTNHEYEVPTVTAKSRLDWTGYDTTSNTVASSKLTSSEYARINDNQVRLSQNASYETVSPFM